MPSTVAHTPCCNGLTPLEKPTSKCWRLPLLRGEPWEKAKSTCWRLPLLRENHGRRQNLNVDVCPSFEDHMSMNHPGTTQNHAGTTRNHPGTIQEPPEPKILIFHWFFKVLGPPGTKNINFSLVFLRFLGHERAKPNQARHPPSVS